MISVDKDKKGRYRRVAGILLLSFLLVGGKTAFCEADEPAAGPVKEIRFGIAAHDVDGLWSGTSREEGPDLSMEILFNRSLFQLLTATAYPNAGVSINTRGDTSKIYGGLLLRWSAPPAFFFSTGLGLALHDGKSDTEEADKKSLGSALLFRIPIELGIAIHRHHRFILAFDHLSNAGLASPNEGLDTVGLLYAFHF